LLNVFILHYFPHWILAHSSVIMAHSYKKCPIDKEGKVAIVPLKFF